jgi:hypothetical protein
LLAVGILLVTAGVVGAACGGGSNDRSALTPGTDGERVAMPGAPVAGIPGEPAAGPQVGEATEEGGGALDIGSLDTGLAQVGPRIVKTASLSVELARGQFGRKFQEAVQIAGRHGGFVASSQTSSGQHPSGTVVIRVPADEFEATLGELKGLGRVKGQEVSGQDVSAQFADLEARLRNWEAQETVLLGLMRKAGTIEESIKVQRSLQDVQLAIEQIRGQLRVLGDQTDFATITASFVQAGAPPAPTPRGTVGRAWNEAIQAFLNVIAAVVVGLGYLVPLGLLGLGGLITWTLVRRSSARPA